jgi:hypothetical protein
MSERTFTSAELALNQAAIVREALVVSLKYRHGPINGIDLETALLAIPTDQPALDRYMAERVREAVRDEQDRLIQVFKADPRFNDMGRYLEKFVTEGRKRRAAASPVCEQAGAPRQPTLTFGDGDYSCASCGLGMKEPCEHWKELLSQAGAPE